MKKILILIFSVVFLFTSCKKEDKKPTASGGSPSANPFPILSSSTGGEISALQTSYTYLDYNGTVTKDSMTFASFYAAPSGSVMPTNVYAGQVKLNGVNIPFDTASSFYYIANNMSINISGGLTWSASGSGTVMGFSQAYTPLYPKYTGGNLLPDTCIKANGVTITVSGVSNNQNSVYISLNSNAFSSSKYILGSNGTVTFTSADLVNFAVNQPITIGIHLANIFTATQNGVKHGFQNILNYQKISYLK